MTCRPIIFRPDLAQAIAEGRKTQTRRVLKPQPTEEWSHLDVGVYHPTMVARDGEEYPGPATFGAWTEDGYQGWRCQHGQPGDYLWVREMWRPYENPNTWVDGVQFRHSRDFYPIENTQTLTDQWVAAWNNDKHRGRWRPSIHMPRWACRTYLQIDRVRVERVQEITEEDAKAEGVEAGSDGSARDWFGVLWEQIHGRGSWERNPWVWVYEFHRVENPDAR